MSCCCNGVGVVIRTGANLLTVRILPTRMSLMVVNNSFSCGDTRISLVLKLRNIKDVMLHKVSLSCRLGLNRVLAHRRPIVNQPPNKKHPEVIVAKSDVVVVRDPDEPKDTSQGKTVAVRLPGRN